jgi:hypothetical protein
MGVSYTGAMSYSLDGTEYDIVFAKVARDKVAIDWMEQGYQGGLIATSEDGITYKGTYSYKDSTDHGSVELQLYQSKNDDVLLIGFWREPNNESGDWMFRLSVLAK